MNHSSRGLLRKFIHLRQFHTTKVKLIDPKTVEEVRIPVPWGHIAGKLWGGKQSSTIVALHGGYDNANSFDKLIPLLNVPSVLCLDLPGHGRSSQLPDGYIYNYIDCLVFLRRLLKYEMKLEKVSFLSHSLGSGFSFVYAALFNDHVDRMVNMDCSRFITLSDSLDLVAYLREAVEVSISEAQPSKHLPLKDFVRYTYHKRKEWGMGVSMDLCQIITDRWTEDVGNGLRRSTLENRIKFSVLGIFPKSTYLKLASQVTCDTLTILPKNGFMAGSKGGFIAPITPEEYMKGLQDSGRSIQKFKTVFVDGGHHAHLTNPENVAPLVNDFFQNLK